MLGQLAGAITRFVSHNNNPLGLLILACCALLEYAFPPFPGDTVTLFGAFLVVRHNWSLLRVFAALMAGSAAGAMLDYVVGARLGRRYRAGGILRSETNRARLDRVLAAFRRYGVAYIAINRFLPGLRAVIFIGAGMAGLRAGWVLVFALISAAAWNALILAVGYLLGTSWDQIRPLFALYGRVVYVVLILVAVGFGLRWWLRTRRPR